MISTRDYGIGGIGFTAVGIFLLLLCLYSISCSNSTFTGSIALIAIGAVFLSLAAYRLVKGRPIEHEETIETVARSSLGPVYTFSKYLPLYAGILFGIFGTTLPMVFEFNTVTIVVTMIFLGMASGFIIWGMRALREETKLADFIFGLFVLVIGAATTFVGAHDFSLIGLTGGVYSLIFGSMVLIMYFKRGKPIENRLTKARQVG